MQTAAPTKPSFRAFPAFETFQLIGLIIGLIWIGPRLFAAINSTSVGLAADAAQHVIKVTFAFFIYLSLRAANRSNALLFPYGTGKFESLANILLAISLVLSALGISAFAGMRLLSPEAPVNAETGIVFLVMSFVINLALYAFSYPHEKSRKTVVTYWRMSYLISLSMKAMTIVCVYLSQQGGAYVHLDAISGLVTAVFMFWLAYKSLVDSVWELSDRALEEKVQLQILRAIADNFNGFDQLKDVRTRRTGGQPTIEVSLGFYDNRSWKYIAHKCQEIERQIASEVTGARVTVSPFPADDVPFRKPTSV